MATAPCCCSQASRRFRKVVRATFRATWWPKGSLISSWFRSPAKGITHVQYHHAVTPRAQRDTPWVKVPPFSLGPGLASGIIPQSPKNGSQERAGAQGCIISRGKEGRLLRTHGQHHPFELKSLLYLSPLPSHSAIWSEGSLERLERGAGTHPARQQFPSGPPRLLHSRWHLALGCHDDYRPEPRIVPAVKQAR